MGRYIIRRLTVALPTLVAVTLVVTGIMSLLPGEVLLARLLSCSSEPASSSAARTVALGAVGGTPRTGPGCYVTEEDIRELRAELGIDKSFPQRYAEWVGGALRGDLGTSVWSGRDVTATIATRLRVSGPLALTAMTIAVLTAVPIGVWSAVRHGRWQDYIARVTSMGGLAVPDFFLAMLVLYGLSVTIGWQPGLGREGWWENPAESLAAIALAALIVGWRIGAISARMTRSAVLDVLHQDYVRTARAKGLAEQSVVVRHALRIALLPLLTIVGMQLPALLAGLVILEVVFGLPGLGTLGFEAVQVRDYPVVQGVVFCSALCVIGTNLVVDIASAALDPRIRYQ